MAEAYPHFSLWTSERKTQSSTTGELTVASNIQQLNWTGYLTLYLTGHNKFVPIMYLLNKHSNPDQQFSSNIAHTVVRYLTKQ